MAHAGYEQLTLGLFDTASAHSLSLGSAPAASAAEPEPVSVPALPPAAVPVTWRLDGERVLAKGWRGRAADNLAAIRLLQRIEAEDRPATAAEGRWQGAVASVVPAYGSSRLCGGGILALQHRD